MLVIAGISKVSDFLLFTFDFLLLSKCESVSVGRSGYSYVETRLLSLIILRLLLQMVPTTLLMSRISTKELWKVGRLASSPWYITNGRRLLSFVVFRVFSCFLFFCVTVRDSMYAAILLISCPYSAGLRCF